VSGAGEPADGVAGQAEVGGDRADTTAFSPQLADGVPLAGPGSHPVAATGDRRNGRRRAVLEGAAGDGWWVLRRGRSLQVLAVPGDGAFHRLAQVLPQMPAVGDLDRVRGSAGAAV
jgi:hypothetical protein